MERIQLERIESFANISASITDLIIINSLLLLLFLTVGTTGKCFPQKERLTYYFAIIVFIIIYSLKALKFFI